MENLAQDTANTNSERDTTESLNTSTISQEESATSQADTETYSDKEMKKAEEYKS